MNLCWWPILNSSRLEEMRHLYLLRLLFLFVFCLNPSVCKLACASSDAATEPHSCCPEKDASTKKPEQSSCLFCSFIQSKSESSLKVVSHSIDLVTIPLPPIYLEEKLFADRSLPQLSDVKVPIRSAVHLPLGSNAPPQI